MNLIDKFKGGRKVDKDTEVKHWPAGDRTEWLKRREQDVTASVAGALVGVHPFITYFGLYRLKAGLSKASDVVTEAMERGSDMEEVAVRRLRKENRSWDVDGTKLYFRAPALRIGATPDCYCYDPKRKGFGIVQIKSVAAPIFNSEWRDEAGDLTIPMWIQVQAIIEAKLTGASWASVAAIVVNYKVELHVLPVDIHEGVWERVKEETALFWKRVEEKDAPHPDYMRDAEAIAGLWPQSNGRVIDLSGDNALPGILARREEITRMEKELEEEKTVLTSAVRMKIGDHDAGTLPGWKISAKTVNYSGHFVPPRTSRPLHVNRVKTKDFIDDGVF